GLIGFNNESVSYSHWDMQSSGLEFSQGGTGRTTEEMTMQGTFINWDFNEIWSIEEAQTYPYLQWQSEPGEHNYADVEIADIVKNTFNLYWKGLKTYNIGLTAQAAADQTTVSWGNFGWRDVSDEPRIEWNNDPEYEYAGMTLDTWNSMYNVIGKVNNLLYMIIEDGAEVGADGEDREMALATLYLKRGLALGQLGMVFDQAFIAMHDDDPHSLTLRPWNEVIEAGIADLETAIQIAGENTFEWDEDALPGIVANNVFIGELASSYAARFLALGARTKAQNEDLGWTSLYDWSDVLDFTSGGLTVDYAPLGDGLPFDGGKWFDLNIKYLRQPGWGRVDMRVINLLDPDAPVRYPTDGFGMPLPPPQIHDGLQPGESVSEDTRFLTDFEFLPHNNFNPDRGGWHFSHYRHSRYDDPPTTNSEGYLMGESQGPLFELRVYDNELMKAEALARTGDVPGASAILNDLSNPRKSRGNLPDIDADEEAVLDAIFYERYIELFHNGWMIHFHDMRRTDMLQKGTPLHFPVPGQVLQERSIGMYTYGGRQNADGVNTSDGGAWIGPYYHFGTLDLQVQGDGYTDPEEGVYFPGRGVEIDIYAFSNPGSVFDHWIVGEIEYSENPLYLYFEEDETVVAHFAETVETQYSLTLAVNGDGSIKPQPATYYLIEGETLKVTASGGQAWVFVNWTDDGGNEVSDQAEFIFTMPGSDFELFANFEVPSYVISGDGVDDIDGNHYPSVIIGDQEWMAENLRVTRYNNGTSIPTGLDDLDWEAATEGAYGIFNHEEIDGINSEEEMVAAYGILYNWYAVNDSRNLCPAGWRVPGEEDWTELTAHLLDNYSGINSGNFGNALKSCRQIDSPLGGECDTDQHPRWFSLGTHFGTDNFGFSGLPGGWRHGDGYYNIGAVGYRVNWWSRDEYGHDAAFKYVLRSDIGYLEHHFIGKNFGQSVRCVKGEIQYFEGGEGTEADPYIVATAGQFYNVRLFPEAHFRQQGDISLDEFPYGDWSTGGWNPLGTYSEPFTGNYDGQGYSIFNMIIDRSDEDEVGLFGYTENAVIHDLVVENVSVNGSDHVGGLVGFAENTTISNVRVSGVISGNSGLGGVAGLSHGDQGLVAASSFSGDVNGTGQYVGGLVGNSGFSAVVEESYSIGTVEGNVHVGGLVGSHGLGSSIHNSYSMVSVSGFEAVGGLVGHSDGEITNSYSTGPVWGEISIGGFAGSNTTVISGSYWDTQSSGMETSDGGEGRTTQQMVQESTFVGWNFAETWGIIEGSTYPFLLWQGEPADHNYADYEPDYKISGDGVADIDGNFYPTVIIGDQEWMAENLRVTQYRTGEPIPGGLNNTDWSNTVEGAYAIYPFGEIDGLESEEEVVDAYGILYNWYTVESGNLCPDGWRVPADDEWSGLIDYLVSGYEEITPENVGNALMSCRQENSPFGGECTTSEHPRWSYNEMHFGTNNFGFSALPSGFRYSDGEFEHLGNYVGWWSSTDYVEGAAWYHHKVNSMGGLQRDGELKQDGYSIRCIKGDIPVVTTNEVTDITTNTAISGGEVVHDGYSEIITVGVVWSNEADPNLDDNFEGFTEDEYIEETTEFISELTGLAPGTQYFVRAYAINSVGTAYGIELEFTTDAVLADVTTAEISEITSSTATSGGEVIDDGGAEVFQFGVVWSTETEPNMDDNFEGYTEDEYIEETTEFISELTGLAPGTQYFVRAYAINSVGTAYGGQVEFTTEDEFGGGLGTESEPYLVQNDYHLNNVRNYLDAWFRQVADIDLSGSPYNDGEEEGWLPIGSTESPFTGSYDGDGYTISNLFIDRNEEDIGFFGIIENGVINNMAIVDAEVINDDNNTGIIAGFSYNSSILNSYATGRLSGGNYIGGLVGTNASDAIISSSYAIVDILSGGNNIGGLAGHNQAEIQSSFAYVFIDIEGDNIGGLAGYNSGDIFNSYSAGEVNGLSNIGGLVGHNAWLVENSYSTCIIGASGSDVGGLIGYNSGGSINYSYWDIDVSGTTESDGGEGKTTAQMTQKATFDQEWDFVTIWDIIERETYPFLLWQGEPADHNYADYEPVMAEVTTAEITGITHSTATSGGEVIDDGGAEVTERGVVWSITENPTTDPLEHDGMISDIEGGTGVFTVDLTGLDPGTHYYVRAYATNSEGTAYGNQVSFTTYDGTVGDVDGNLYPTVIIGDQVWMAKNLRVTSYSDNSQITTGLDDAGWSTAVEGAYTVFPHESVDGIDNDEEMLSAYGALYNWYAIETGNLCPDGWHVPSEQEWMQMIEYIVINYPEYDYNNVGNALKSCRQIDSPLDGECSTYEHPRWEYDVDQFGTNEFRFNALPGGQRDNQGSFSDIGLYGFWWSSEFDLDNANYNMISYTEGEVSHASGFKNRGHSVRCVSNFAGGKGTEEDPYLVATDVNLYYVRSEPDAYFRQIADIDLSMSPYTQGDDGWEPIGDDIAPFTGSYDGDDFSINSLSIYWDEVSETGYRGLFGVIEGASVSNMQLMDVYVKGMGFVGGLVGEARNSEISGIKVTGNVSGDSIVGGLAGANTGPMASITRSFSGADVYGTIYEHTYGGLVGLNDEGATITESFSFGWITGNQRAGGLVGHNGVNSKIENSYSATNNDCVWEAGGLAGYNEGEIINCYSVGTVDDSGNFTMGLVGHNDGGVIVNSYWDTEASGNTLGLAGAEGKTTEEMLMQGTFIDWDFNFIWFIQEGETYPYLQWQGDPGPFNSPGEGELPPET
ncbi:MAG: hypothetical protein EA408_09840, partial [Marinilabiliales bacterium]